jgi:limonene-1,2-epoxide hydrolase
MSGPATERNLTVVRRVCEAWSELEREEFHQLFDAQVDYRNVPIEGDRHIGPDAICDVLSRLRRSWEVELRVDHIVGDDSVVMTERLEKFRHRAGTKDPFELPVMGAFELRDGRIAAWRDYFDLSQLRLR